MKYFTTIFLCFLTASVISLTGVFAMQSTELVSKADTDFQNLPYGIAIGINLCSFLSSLTIFLNLKETVSRSTTYSALSFFLLPVLLVLFLLLAM